MIALLDNANLAFVDAMTVGFFASAGFVALAAVVAVTLIPKTMRKTQAQLGDDAMPSGDPGDPEPALESAAA